MTVDLNFRTLRANEIDCRVSQINDKGLTLLLYKDARCDMNMLDEIVGPMNWMRTHSRDNANCTVSIYDKDRGEWVPKEDTGTESNTEAQKGLASDSFKRACVNWGIGRELYTAPRIFIPAGNYRTYQAKNGKTACADTFYVSCIEYNNDREISALEIANRNRKNVVFTFGSPNQKASDRPRPAWVCAVCGEEIRPFNNKGQIIPADEMAKRSVAVYGKPVCLTCANKINGTQGA